MTETKQRTCGLYRTTVPLGEVVPAGALVYYHNHGDPGPGVYLPREWRHNRAIFAGRGTVLPDASYAETLEPLLPEGLYRVAEPFTCCEQRCHLFEPELLVQLGYNGRAEPLLFIPELEEGALSFPEKGTRIEPEKLVRLRPLRVAEKPGTSPEGDLPPSTLN